MQNVDAPMPTKVLGRTGMVVSTVGLGTGHLGLPRSEDGFRQYEGNAARRSFADVNLGIEAVCVALEAGVTLIDTAPKYGFRASERMIGQALRERPDLAAVAVVTTKVGSLDNLDGFDYSTAATRSCFMQSLATLGVQRLPLVYLHDPMSLGKEFVMGGEGPMAALRDLRRDGLIDFIGVAANDPECAADYIETGEFDAAIVVGAWSLINQRALARIIPAAMRHKTGLVCATAIERGLLAVGPVSGWRYQERSFSPECFAWVRKMMDVCSNYRVSLLAAALQWTTRHPQFASAIPGARVAGEVAMNAEAGRTAIPEDFWPALEALVRTWEY